MTATAPQRRQRPVVLLRPVPGTSVVHRLWAGTKLVIVFAISVLLTFYPEWAVIGAVGALVLSAAVLAHVPRGALPSVPKWLWMLIALGAVIPTFGGGEPFVHLPFLHVGGADGGVSVGLGGLLDFLRVASLAVILLGLSAMVSWTTNVADIAPAVAALGRPLRLLRIPVDEWAVTLALALRAFPMLIDEFRVLYAARRMRPRRRPVNQRQRFRGFAIEVVDLVTAAITVTLRRADEMGDAITARGGSGRISAAPSRPGPADWVALLVVFLVCGSALISALR